MEKSQDISFSISKENKNINTTLRNPLQADML
jgi:hypothetical protein